MNELSYRQIQNELKKRQLNSNGKKNIIVKRLKIAYEKEIKNQSSYVTKFHDLPNEIYRDIFDYLLSFNIIHSFYGLNHRLNEIIQNIPMKLNFNNLNKIEYKRILKYIVPKIINQTMAIDLGESSKIISCFSSSCYSEFVIDLFIQSFNLIQFSNLRFLSLTALNQKQLETLFLIIPNMSSLRSLRLLEQNYCCSSNETICKLVLANNSHYSIDKSNHLTHVFIETNPPFKILTLLHKYFINKISFDYIQINIRCALYFYVHALACLDCNGLSNLISNMTYFKIDVTIGTFQSMFELIRRFSKIHHLSVKTTLQAYANGHQWAELLAQMPNIIKLDLDIHLDSYKSDQELQAFQTKFWFARQWIVQCIKSQSNCSECKIIHRSI
ncbi:unnamed protein product [Rotaria sordida]|uniref:F-box domain-containing protein n=1 Tax=Rotaria sordida TaxID=392033 RepID=A0A818P8U7_9BILA|nr:unnamed protein product [Rotaria sordida]